MTYTSLTSPEQITDEIVSMVVEVLRGWYPDNRTDWEDVWDRVDGSELSDGTRLDLGTDLLSPALRKLRKLALQEK